MSNEFHLFLKHLLTKKIYCPVLYILLEGHNILTDQTRDVTKLKLVWLVNMAGNSRKIIFSPALSIPKDEKYM